MCRCFIYESWVLLGMVIWSIGGIDDRLLRLGGVVWFHIMVGSGVDDKLRRLGVVVWFLNVW